MTFKFFLGKITVERTLLAELLGFGFHLNVLLYGRKYWAMKRKIKEAKRRRAAQ